MKLALSAAIASLLPSRVLAHPITTEGNQSAAPQVARCLLVQRKELCLGAPETCDTPANGGWYCADENFRPMRLEGDIPDGIFDDLVSSMTILEISDATKVDGHTIVIEDGATLTLIPNDGEGEWGATARKLGSPGFRGSKQRQLLTPDKTGAMTVLVVRIEDENGEAPTQTEENLSHDWFGPLSEDPLNMKSQFEACSGGKLTFQVADSVSSTGVITITLPSGRSAVGASRYDIDDWAEDVLENMMGASASSLANFVVYVTPDSVSWDGVAAYAYIGNYKSVFKSEYASDMGVQLHEFGHNIGVYHSGEGGLDYGDHSCMMGNPNLSFRDDGAEMCFNGAKSWYFGWYSELHQGMYPHNGYNSWGGKLMGIDDFVNGNYDSTYTTVLLIENPQSVEDLYIMFNRAKGINEGVVEKRNEVTIVEAQSRFQSWMLESISVSGTPVYRYASFSNGFDLVVEVCEEVFPSGGSSPDYARIIAYIDNGVDNLDCNQTPEPTPVPTTHPTPEPTTGLPPGPTSGPTLMPTSPPTSPPTPGPTQNPTTPTVAPTPSPVSPTPAPTPEPTKAPSPVVTGQCLTTTQTGSTTNGQVHVFFEINYDYAIIDFTNTGLQPLSNYGIENPQGVMVESIDGYKLTVKRGNDPSWPSMTRSGTIMIRSTKNSGDSELASFLNPSCVASDSTDVDSTPAPISTPPPTNEPTPEPTFGPTTSPTASPTTQPSPPPTESPTPAPMPTPDPTSTPTPEPSPLPTPAPVLPATPDPTPEPSAAPTSRPTQGPTLPPTTSPTISPTGEPTYSPSWGPTSSPVHPTPEPTPNPSPGPTIGPAGDGPCVANARDDASATNAVQEVRFVTSHAIIDFSNTGIEELSNYKLENPQGVSITSNDGLYKLIVRRNDEHWPSMTRPAAIMLRSKKNEGDPELLSMVDATCLGGQYINQIF